MAPQIDLTITDDFPLAQAVVIISAVPKEFVAVTGRSMTLRVMVLASGMPAQNC